MKHRGEAVPRSFDGIASKFPQDDQQGPVAAGERQEEMQNQDGR
jgi:hypothetical protein